MSRKRCPACKGRLDKDEDDTVPCGCCVKVEAIHALIESGHEDEGMEMLIAACHEDAARHAAREAKRTARKQGTSFVGGAS